MHNYHLGRGPPTCAFKVDIQKAYDTVDWIFLHEALIGFRFHYRMIGQKPVKYLGVPLILTRLVYRDYKELIKKIQNRVRNWKNKSLSAAGRLQLIKSVIGYMHIYWALVFILPTRILHNIKHLMRGFLCYQGDMQKGKAKVAWDVSYLKVYTGLPKVASSLNSIIDAIIAMPKRRSIRGIIARLVFAASTFFKEAESIGFRLSGCEEVALMALPIQNIHHSAFRSMFEREKLFGNYFNDWFRQLKLVLRVEKKMFVIEQPLPVAPAADSEAQVLAQWNAVYDAYNEEGKQVGPYVLEMKGYVEQLKRLGYMLPQDISVGLILNGHTSDFAGFVRNYNMHNMGKTVGELHALLIEYEKGLPKKAATPQLMAIQGGRIQKANKKSQILKERVKEKASERIKVISLSLKTLNLQQKSTQ
nr:zinc finger, CCHC-type [Tanacetum cinerariifolium]